MENFSAHIDLHRTSEKVACRAFPLTLLGNARDWFRKLPLNSINDFDQLSKMFLMQFMAGRVRRKPSGSLMSLHQGPEKSLKDFFMRFNQARLDAESATDDFIYGALFQGIRKDGALMADIARKPPRNLDGFMSKAKKYINQEETLRALLGPNPSLASGFESRKLKKKDSHNEERMEQVEGDETKVKRERKLLKNHNWTTLNAPIMDILMEIKRDLMYQKPRPMLPNPQFANQYCTFHDTTGHRTEACISLRILIERFIENGKLVRFFVDQRSQANLPLDNLPREDQQRAHQNWGNHRADRERRHDEDREPNPQGDRERRERSRSRANQASQENLPEIQTIAGGFGGGGESSSARKAYARQIRNFEVYSIQKPPKSRKRETEIIEFSDDDYAGVFLPHTDALVLSLAIANHKIHRILIDTGSLADILYKSAFELIKIDPSKVILARHSLVGFSGEQVLPLGSIELPVMEGTYPKQKTIMVKFLIINHFSAYKVILGRTTLNDLKAVTSTPHLSMKFPTEEGIGTEKGYQRMARECYNMSLRKLPKTIGYDGKSKEEGK